MAYVRLVGLDTPAATRWERKVPAPLCLARRMRTGSGACGSHMLGRRLARGLCSSDAFSSGWTLPFRQIPWALPFRVSQQEAICAFHEHHTADDNTPKLTLRGVRPCHLPFYVFEGSLSVSFTGIVGYDDGGDGNSHGWVQATEYSRRDIPCPPAAIGADSTAVSAVYAGFQFRRLYVRMALTEGLSEDALQAAVPLNRLPSALQPRGATADDFEMKPSFAYKERILSRLPEVAHHEAERRLLSDDVRALAFWADGTEQSMVRAAAQPTPRIQCPLTCVVHRAAHTPRTLCVCVVHRGGARFACMHMAVHASFRGV
jgi:hypothetical protein